jgi:hypothetical protein
VSIVIEQKAKQTIFYFQKFIGLYDFFSGVLEKYPFLLALTCLVLAFTCFSPLYANSDGRRTQRTILNATSCGTGSNCHSSVLNSAVQISALLGNRRIADSIVVMPGSRTRLTIMVAHSNPAAGVNIAIRTGLTNEIPAGTITAVDNSLTPRGTSSSELTHSQPKAKAQGDTVVSFTFDWVAPTTVGTYFLRAISNSVNRNAVADAADVWNWLQPVRLVVSGVVSVQQPNDIGEQFQMSPNPMNDVGTFSWALPSSMSSVAGIEEYSIRLVNAQGVELRSWNGIVSAGRVIIPFDGKDAHGLDVRSGQYFAVLQTRKRQFVRGVTIVR